MSETKHDLNLVIKATDKASSPLGRIGARLSALTSKSSPAGQALRGVGAAGAKLGGQLATLGAQLSTMAVGAALGLGVLVNKTIESGSELNKMSERLGVSATWYATMSRAAEVAEVSQDEFASSLTKLSKNLGDAKAGTGEALSALKEMSPVFAAQFKAARSTSEAFTLVTKALAAIPDAARRNALAAAVMGKGAVNMAAFMGQGTGAINKQAAEIFKLIGAQGEFAKSADAAGDEIQKTSMAFEGLRHAAVAALLPALTKVATYVTKYFADNREGVKQWADKAGKAINEWVQGGGLQRVGDMLGKIADFAGKVYRALGPLGTALVVSAPLWLPVAAGVVGLAASLATLEGAVALPLLPVIALGAAVVAMWANWDKLKDLPILSEIDALLGVVLKVTKAVWALREATGGGGAPGEETLTSEPLTRAQVEQQAQRKALGNVGRGILEGFAGAAATAVPGLGMLRATGQAVQGIGKLSGGASAGATPRTPAEGGALTSEPAKAEVLVSFSGAPAGTRMSIAPGATAEVDLSMGPTMSGP